MPSESTNMEKLTGTNPVIIHAFCKYWGERLDIEPGEIFDILYIWELDFRGKQVSDTTGAVDREAYGKEKGPQG
ncbi:hypothetical protein LCGC14_0338390 [marine sediment metagenome]|uniref:Uncharacterized protein n=1 Tax=marine sediment metagenome TaxID=412755 RepID=A0A0F9TEI8_9ZZZZ